MLLLDKSCSAPLSKSGAFISGLNELARDRERRNVSLSELAHRPSHLSVLHNGPFIMPGTLSQVTALDLNRSKILPSNARPLLLRFSGVTSESSLIWKAGDDLATDQLVVSLGRVMNAIWKAAGLSAFVVDYHVAPTGHRVGAIEMVPDCTSLGKIQGNWSGAFKNGAIVAWLKSDECRAKQSGDWSQVIQRFSSSLAGACVFEYVLGLGDRHCDNLLMRPTGEIFHIDFGCSFGRDFGMAQVCLFVLYCLFCFVLFCFNLMFCLFFCFPFRTFRSL